MIMGMLLAVGRTESLPDPFRSDQGSCIITGEGSFKEVVAALGLEGKSAWNQERMDRDIE